MTTDERIDRLTERHEALTQSVESLLASTREQSTQIETLGAVTREQSTQIETLGAVTREHSTQLGEIMEATARLLHVAQIHEARISRLEDQDGDELRH